MSDMGSALTPSNGPLPPIYVVDDHLEICLSLDALLSAHGFDVTCFTNPAEFVATRRSLKSGIVLLDVRMPQMSGLEVLVEIQGDLERLQTILITAHGEIDTAVKAIKLGAQDFIQKPFREKALLEVIQHAIDNLEPRANKERQPWDSLTPRERDVVLGLSRGVPNKIIAYELGISVRTVEMHRARAMQRLGCKTLADLLRLAFSSPAVVD